MVVLKRQKVSEVQRGDTSKDKISRFPDCLLQHILSFLPTKDVVSTGILSRRWKDFDDFLLYSSLVCSWCPVEVSCFMNFVERVLLLRDGSSIRNFRLSCRVCFSTSRVHSWISAAVSRKVQQLNSCLFVDAPFLLPLAVFDCKSLAILKLEMNCTLHLPSHISLPTLKVSHLCLVTFSNDESIQELFSCCPILEELAILDCEWTRLNCITISIPLLKSLTMDDLPVFVPVDDHEGCDINIEAPTLRFFKYSGYLTNEVHLSEISSSVKALPSHTYCVPKQREKNGWCCQAASGFEDINCTLDLLFLAENGLNYLPVFQHLERLELSMQLEDHVVKGLGLDSRLSISEDELMLNSLPNCFLSSLKTLGLWDFRGNIGELFLLRSFLENAVSLQRINIFPCKTPTLNPEEQQKWRAEVESLSSRLCLLHMLNETILASSAIAIPPARCIRIHAAFFSQPLYNSSTTFNLLTKKSPTEC